jgi:GT2 family glycosyltransferase
MCDPLEPSGEGREIFMVAPKCLRFDDETYEGFRTAVWWKLGLLRATALFPGHEPSIDQPGLSASVGAVMAVDRLRFLELGGFDPLYLPGRLEDLDLAFRAFLRGYTIRYEPTALTWHRGMATFAKAFGEFGCDQLALRNTMLFQWKNLRTPSHLLRQLVGLPIRLAADWLRLPLQRPGERLPLTRAFFGALVRLPRALGHGGGWASARLRREREFFRRFSPQRLRSYF